jgi:hypothetical protein
MQNTLLSNGFQLRRRYKGLKRPGKVAFLRRLPKRISYLDRPGVKTETGPRVLA